jgi:thiamine-monophosphate kinase
MIDLSDGLAGDLAHLCAESGVGARIERAALPVGAALERGARTLGADARDLVLAGGEDYELLFAAPIEAGEAARAELEARFGTALTRIGIAQAPPEIVLATPGAPDAPLVAASFDHFAR